MGFVPDGWWHATCNADIAVGIGAQGDISQWPEVVRLAQAGNITGLRQAKGAAALKMQSRSISALHVAGAFGHLSAVKSVLESHGTEKSGLHLHGFEGQTPLHSASQSRNPSAAAIVDALIAARGNLAAKDDKGNTPLHAAAARGELTTVEMLLRHGANSRAQNKEGRQPAHLAAVRGSASILTVLIQGESTTDVVGGADTGKRTPLHHAVESGHISACQALLQARASVDATDKFGNTGLHVATRRLDEQTVQLLLAARADFDSANLQEEKRPLHYVTEQGGAAARRIAMSLLELRAEAVAGKKGNWRPLHLAATTGDVAMIELLLERRAEAKMGDDKGRLPSLFAQAKGHTEAEGLLRRLEQ